MTSPQPFDVREIWFSNMHLLGLQASLCDEKYQVTFVKEMFEHINKKGSEAVLHFLFSKLDPHLSSEVFRDCWPVYDKKLEQQFRKACSNWLARITKEEPHSKLPRMAASLLLSPGGDKFYLFLLRFTCYILKQFCTDEAKSVGRSSFTQALVTRGGKQLFLSDFVTSIRGFGDAHTEAARYAMQSHLVRHSHSIQQRAYLVCALHKEWESYASQLAVAYRRLAKECRALAGRLLSLEEEQKHRVLTSTPQRHPVSGNRAKDDHVLSLTAAVASKQRDSRIAKAREMWKELEKFVESSNYFQEVIDSVVQGRVNMYAIKAKDITFQIPEMILHEYEALSRGGTASNTYEAGKLNLICLIRMWNCSLHLIKTKIQKGGLPDFEKELDYTSAEIRSHRAHLAAASNLRGSLSVLRSSLEQSIEQLEEELRNYGGTPLSVPGGRDDSSVPRLFVPEIAIPSLGLELLPPSPRKSHAPDVADDHRVLAPPLNSLLTQSISTPDAVRGISVSIHEASRSKRLPRHSSSADAAGYQSSRIPLRKEVSGTRSSKLHNQTWSARNVLHEHQASSLQQSHVSSGRVFDGRKMTRSLADETTPVRALGAGVSTPHENGTHSVSGSGDIWNGTQHHLTPSVLTPKLLATAVSSAPHLTTPDALTPKLLATGVHLTTPDALTPKLLATPATTVPSSTTRASPANPTPDPRMKTPAKGTVEAAHEKLADQIAAAVLSQSDSDDSFTPDQMHSVMDTIAAMGKEAFISRDVLARTPQKDSQTSSGRSPATPLSHSLATPQDPQTSLTAPLSIGKHPGTSHATPLSIGKHPGTSHATPLSIGKHPGTSHATPLSIGKDPGTSHATPLSIGKHPGTSHTTPLYPGTNHATPLSIGKHPGTSHATPLSNPGTTPLKNSMWSLQDEQQPQLASPDCTPNSASHTPNYHAPADEQRHASAGHTPAVEQFTSATPNSVGHTPNYSTPADEQGPLFTSATPKLTDSQPSLSGQRSFGHTSMDQNSPMLFAPAHHRTILPSPLVTSRFSTPTHQAMSFLQDILPPSPFQHAEFDLDSPEDEPPSQDEPASQSTGAAHEVTGHAQFPQSTGFSGHTQFSEATRTPPPAVGNISLSESIGAAQSSQSAQSPVESTLSAVFSGSVGNTLEHSIDPDPSSSKFHSRAVMSPLDNTSFPALVDISTPSMQSPLIAHTSGQVMSPDPLDNISSPALGTLVDISVQRNSPLIAHTSGYPDSKATISQSIRGPPLEAVRSDDDLDLFGDAGSPELVPLSSGSELELSLGSD